MKQDLMHTTKKNAFTLMEMLIVVAIIAALVAITIPVMSASLKKAKTAACQSNRRALLALLEVTYMTDGEDAVETVFQKNKDQYACPSDGVITYELDRDTGAITVNCSVHT